MKPLSRVLIPLNKELTRYKRILKVQIDTTNEAQDGYREAVDFAREQVLVAAQDSWSRFARELVITSALGNVVNIHGHPVVRSSIVISRSDCLRVLAADVKFKGRKPVKEPKWFDVQELLYAAQLLGLKNYASISLATTGIDTFARIRIARNYYAHRTDFTAKELRRMLVDDFGVSYSKPFLKALVEPRMPNGDGLIGSWFDELETVARWACE